VGSGVEGGRMQDQPIQLSQTAEPAARPRGEGSNIQSVDRALNLLQAIAEVGGEATLTELSGRTRINISTCHHLLATLVKRGFVTKWPARRGYALGGRILQLSQACLQVDLPRRAEPFIERINSATGETVHLAARQGDHLATLLTREARHAVRVDTAGLGVSEAAHASATGKAMLAWLPEDEIRRIVTTSGMKKFTPNTITDFVALIEELRLVRRRGFAIDREEFQPGVICIGAAIRNHSGAVVGAISASTPTMRASEEHLARMREAVVSATRALSAELGEPGAQATNKAPLAPASA
jgi:IclR family acetate operon transcriptional repressor